MCPNILESLKHDMQRDCRGPIPAPTTERQAGLTYVNLSRLTEWRNLCIVKAIPLDRLTTKISKCKGLSSRIQEDSR